MKQKVMKKSEKGKKKKISFEYKTKKNILGKTVLKMWSQICG